MPKLGYVSSKDKNVNTDGMILYGTNAALGLDFWNGAVSVKIYPLRGEDKKEGETKFDYRNKVQCTLNIDKAITLAHYIETRIIPGCLQGKPAAIGIQTAKVNMIYISSGVEETGHVEPYLALFLDINENKIPGRMLIMRFRTERLFNKYNKDTGEFESIDTYEDALRGVAAFLKNSINVFGSTVHGSELVNYEKNRMEEEFRSALANKFGITYNNTPSYVRNYGSRIDPWGDTSTTKEIEGTPSEQKTITLEQLNSVEGLISSITNLPNKFPLATKTLKKVIKKLT